MNFFCILKSIHPNAQAFYSVREGHVITKIDKYYYDITGVILKIDGYKLFTDIYATKKITSTSFIQMYNEFLKFASI